MRITQNMLTNSSLKYISQNYERLAQIQDQINTGKKITRPSDDPVVAMKGMRYRSELEEVEQFYRNLTEGFTWLENSDTNLDETTQVLNRIRELSVEASNDTYDFVARESIAEEIEQLQEHLVTLANAKIGDNYIFNGTDTNTAPVNENLINLDYGQFKTNVGTAPDDYVVSYQGETFTYNAVSGTVYEFQSEVGNSIFIDTASDQVTYQYQDELEYKDGEITTFTKSLDTDDIVISNRNAVSTNAQDVEIEVMKGVTIPINVRAQEAFSIELFSGIESIKKMLTDPDVQGTEIEKSLAYIDDYLTGVTSTRAELGARQNRAELVEDRLLKQQVIAEQTVSDNEDIEFEKAIIDLTTQESLHRAALAASARIIQPTLMDFLS